MIRVINNAQTSIIASALSSQVLISIFQKLTHALIKNGYKQLKKINCLNFFSPYVEEGVARSETQEQCELLITNRPHVQHEV